MLNKFVTNRKAAICAALSVFLTFELMGSSFAAGLSDNTVPIAQTLTHSVSGNYAGGLLLSETDDPSRDHAGSDTDCVPQTMDDASDPELIPESIPIGQSLKATFYDVINGQLVPFYDAKDPQKQLLCDITVSNNDGSAYMDEALRDDLPYYEQINPANPTPWLRIMPVRRGYQVVRWRNLNNNKEYPAYTKESDPTKCLYSDIDLSTLKKDIRFQAIYNTSPYTFQIIYHTDNGVLGRTVDDACLPDYFNVETEDMILPTLEKEGYRFTGWYEDELLSKPISQISKGTYLDSDEYGFVPAYHLYAGWEKLTPGAVTLTKAKYTKKGTIKIQYKPSPGADGYEICFSDDKRFSKNVNSFDNGKNTSYTLSNLIKGTYYIKVRAYIYDSMENKIYSDYSTAKKCKVKAGVKEYSAKDAKITIQKVTITGQNTLYIKAKAPKRIASTDYSYHLVRINAQTGKLDQKNAVIVASLPKIKSLQFNLRLTKNQKAALIQGCYALAIQTQKGLSVVSNSMLINNPEKAATYTAKFPQTKTPSKKGLQGAGGTSALGVQHFFFNMDVTKMLSSASDTNATPYPYNGKTYYFNVEEYKKTIKIANAQGLVVTGQIGMSWPGDEKKYLIPSGARTLGHPYYSLNFSQAKARDELEALFCYMAETFSADDCHLDNWILGNEVNMHSDWFYAGNVSRDKFMANYADAFRGLYYAVKSSSANARVYICLDHNWMGNETVWGARPFMDSFNKVITKYNKAINWNLAYHLYPQDLNNAATWNDTLATNSSKAAYVTPRNLDVMTKYVKKKFGEKTRIILSEQGFTSNSGISIQAAGIAYTFYKAQFDPMIDAVIFHRYKDDPTEKHAGNGQMLNYGICYSTGAAKTESYHVFKFMDSPVYATYTDSCLKTIGISSWKEIAPKFDPSKLTNIP